jgi:hypothetical protein
LRRLVLALAAVLAVTGSVGVASGGVKNSYSHAYYAVKHQHGNRAPGRNIRRDGVRTKHGVRPATARDLRRSTKQLNLMRFPRAAQVYLNAGAPKLAPAGVQSPVAGGQLAAIAACESGGNPRAIGGGGAFRGKYQFDYQTWASVGGSGDPAAASEQEQDRRAAMLLARSGTHPWPVCGG